MASRETSSQKSESTQSSSLPIRLPDSGNIDIEKYRKTKDAEKAVAFVKSEYQKSKQARSTKQLQWYTNMAFFFGQQWVEVTGKTMPSGYQQQLFVPKTPYYKQRKVVNRTRSFVRSELSKFLSSTPVVSVVPGSSEDEDQRAAYAGEQAWQSISDAARMRYHYSRAAWWAIITGVGFVKTWWDKEAIDRFSGEKGTIRMGSVTPFHLFVPDLREQDIDEQPYIINAYVRSVEWCRLYFKDALKGIDLKASTTSANSILEGGYLNLSESQQKDSVVVYEAWLKPGATELYPNGAVLVIVEDYLISATDKFPYDHGMYPFTKFEHIPTSTFYADSPLVDTNSLQKEYNTLRGEIHEAGRRMARPQLLAQKGSIIPSKITNEPGLVVEYRQGFQPPTPMALSPLPQYYIEQQDRILLDWEDITGEKEVTRGSAPTGVTAGTAINYLQEAANQYLTTQFQGIEEGTERIARQAVSLFIQYVDVPRKIKTVGADGAFDTILLQGSDIATATDLRVEAGSSVPKSQAAKEAKVMDMFSVGLLSQDMALKMLDVGGVQKVMDTLNIAEKQAQRENTKMKMLTDEDIQKAQQEWEERVVETVNKEFGSRGLLPGGPVDSIQELPPEIAQEIPPMPPIIPVNDWDIHAQHIDTHNRFRMGQQFETLSDAVKEQFEQHVSMHQQYLMMAQMQEQMNQPGVVPSGEGGEGMPPEMGEMPPGGEGMPPQEQMGPGAQMAPNGAVPDMTPVSE